MGYSVKFNWALKISPPDPIALNCSYEFSKSGNRIFPIDIAIDLIDEDRTAIAKVKIKSFTNDGLTTTGRFEVVKIYSGEEKQVLTNYWIENE